MIIRILIVFILSLIYSKGFAQCPDGFTPSGDCKDISWIGCCTLDGQVKFCDNDTLCVGDCKQYPYCGWTGSYYDCGTDGSADPSGKNPLLCPSGVPCGKITYEGCCEGNIVKWCENGLQMIDCSKNSEPYNVCGWSQDYNIYDCGGKGSDPSGKHPISCSGCQPSCQGKACGPDGCGGSCGTCPAGYGCVNGNCIKECTPKCEGKLCGDDGCGGSCGKCPEGYSCDAFGKCQPLCTPSCAGKECGPDGCGGSCGQCTQGKTCTNGKCTGGIQTDGCSPTDMPGCGGCKCEACVCKADPFCCTNAWDELCVEECDTECNGNCNISCVPNCLGKECGDGGCPDQPNACGQCPQGGVCINGMCKTGPLPCEPDCSGKECGDGGCPDKPNACGTCPDGKTCKLGKCVAGCVPNCSGKQCGDDGCGGECGKCLSNQICKDGICTSQGACVAKCDGKECGQDGCGGVCGVCVPPSICNEEKGRCYDPTKCPEGCDGKTTPCSQKCKGDCGVCPHGKVCNENGVCSGGTTPDTSIVESNISESIIQDAKVTQGEMTCPDGTVLKYGICQSLTETKTKGGSSGGCLVGSATSPCMFLIVILIFCHRLLYFLLCCKVRFGVRGRQRLFSQ